MCSFCKHFVFSILALTVWGCSKSAEVGPFHVQVVQPTAESCEYQIAEGQIQTLSNLKRMEGALGKVVYQNKELLSDDFTLDFGIGFESVDVQFSKSDTVYNPLDYASLFATSLYWSLEQAHLLFSSLDARANMITRLGNTSETLIIHEARALLDESGKETTDNAAFLGHYYVGANGSLELRNYFFSFPTDEVASIPLGINLGVMAHEYTHFVSFHLFKWTLITRFGGLNAIPTHAFNTLMAVDEGVADYFGYLASNDSRFLVCSLPGSDRDLAISKTLSQEIVNSLRTDDINDFDPHDAGAVLASALYQAAERSSDKKGMGRSLVLTLDKLASCVPTSTAAQYSFTLSQFKSCHLQNMSGNLRQAMETAYTQAFGGYY